MTASWGLICAVPELCMRLAVHLLQAALDRKGRLAACVAEAVRLRAPGIDLRMAAAELRLPLGGGRQLHVRKVGRRAAPACLRTGCSACVPCSLLAFGLSGPEKPRIPPI